MAENDDDDNAMVGILEDIAALARMLANQEPFKSATGPEALQTFASHLECMVSKTAEGMAPAAERPAHRKRLA